MKKINLLIIISLITIFILSFSVNGAIAKTWCKGLAYGNVCFNGSTGSNVLTGISIDYSLINGLLTNFYTKTQINNNFSNYYTKLQIHAKYRNISEDTTQDNNLISNYNTSNVNWIDNRYFSENEIRNMYFNKTQDLAMDIPELPILFDDLTYWTTARTEGIGICAALSSGTAAVVAPKNQQVGRVSFLDSTTANGGYRCATDTANMMYFTGNERFVTRFDLPNAANVLNTTIKFGFSDATTVADAVDGCYFKAINRNLQGICRNNSVSSVTTTNLTLGQNQNYIGEIIVNRLVTSVNFSIYNFTSCTNMTQVYKNILSSCTMKFSKTVTSKIPKVAGNAFGIVIDATQSSTSAGAILVNWDYFYFGRK